MDAHRPCILVVDDLATNRFLLEETLAELGVEILSAEGGSRALELAAERAPEVVLLDFQMPDLDGGETALRLKAMRGTPFSYVILMSGHRDAHDEIPESVRAVVDHFLAKPYTLSDMRGAVVEGLRTARQRRS